MGIPRRMPVQELPVAGQLPGRELAALDTGQGGTDSSWSRELVKAIAEDIGKDTIAYIEVMYPDAIKAASSTFKTSVRNHIYNQIMAAIEVNDAGQISARLKDRADFRRWWLKTYRTIRRKAKRPNGEQR